MYIYITWNLEAPVFRKSMIWHEKCIRSPVRSFAPSYKLLVFLEVSRTWIYMMGLEYGHWNRRHGVCCSHSYPVSLPKGVGKIQFPSWKAPCDDLLLHLWADAGRDWNTEAQEEFPGLEPPIPLAVLEEPGRLRWKNPKLLKRWQGTLPSRKTVHFLRKDSRAKSAQALYCYTLWISHFEQE